MWCPVVVLLMVLFHTELSEAESTLPKGTNCTVKAHLPCVKYSIFNSADCAPQNLARLFPHLYGQDNWPGQAYTFDLETIEQYSFNGTLYNAADVNLTFQPPHNVGVKSVRGFEIMIYKNLADVPTCIIYDLANATWKGDLEDMRTVFELNMVVSPGAYYLLELYCLPRPQLEHTDLDEYQPIRFKSPNYSKSWTAAIYWNIFPTERRVAVTFFASNEKIIFERFELTLHACTCEDACDCVSASSADSHTQRVIVTEMFHNFTNVQTGNYTIWVKPIQPHPFDYAQCLCKNNGACDICPTTDTVPFEVKYVPGPTSTSLPSTSTTPGVQPTMIVPGPTSTSLPSTSTPTSPSSVSTMPGVHSTSPNVQPTVISTDVTDIKIIVAVLGSVLGLVLGSIGFWLYYQRRRKENTENELKHDTDTKHENPGFNDDNGSMITIDVLKAEKLGKMLNNNNKPPVALDKVAKLFILYEEDHECHRSLVVSFASYLHHYCHCQVMCASWQQDAPWVHQEMQQADYVVIVNSEAAYNIYKSRKGGKSTGGGGGSPMSSINCVLETFLQEVRYDNIIMVYFEHTSERFLLPDICPGYNYRLMKHFTDFLLHVHQLRRTDNLAQYDLPFDGNHVQRGMVGQQLEQAINRCKKYECENPKWFLLKYGMSRSVSNTSDDSQLDSGMGEMPSLPQTPCHEIKEPWTIHPGILAYLPQLDQFSQGAVTINPPADIPTRPVLSPHSFIPDAVNHDDSPPQTQPSTAESGQFDFIPPDDFPDADIWSKTQSEQMMSIVDRYHISSGVGGAGSPPLGRGYNPDHDLALLRIQSGEIPFTIDLTNSGDVESLGGESV